MSDPWIIRALTGALVGVVFLGGSPLLAREGRPTLRVVAGGALEFSGDPSRPMLLVTGLARAGADPSGRRLQVRKVLRVSLDTLGNGSFHPGQAQERVCLQVWQASAECVTGHYSHPVCLTPPGRSMNSVAHHGDLVITEFMKDPSAVSDSHGEWIELHNNKAWRLDIEGLTVSDLSGSSFTLNNGGLGIQLAPGQYFLLGNDANQATNGGVPVDYEWTGFNLKNSSDEILLVDTHGHLIESVTYDDGLRWPDIPGMSISLDAYIYSAVINDDPGRWCHASSLLAGGPDTGTPGTGNDYCP